MVVEHTINQKLHRIWLSQNIFRDDWVETLAFQLDLGMIPQLPQVRIIQVIKFKSLTQWLTLLQTFHQISFRGNALFAMLMVVLQQQLR